MDLIKKIQIYYRDFLKIFSNTFFNFLTIKPYIYQLSKVTWFLIIFFRSEGSEETEWSSARYCSICISSRRKSWLLNNTFAVEGRRRQDGNENRQGRINVVCDRRSLNAISRLPPALSWTRPSRREGDVGDCISLSDTNLLLVTRKYSKVGSVIYGWFHRRPTVLQTSLCAESCSRSCVILGNSRALLRFIFSFSRDTRFIFTLSKRFSTKGKFYGVFPDIGFIYKFEEPDFCFIILENN